MQEVVSGKDQVLVIDQMPLRRAQVVRFLECWAQEHGLRIASSSIAEVTSSGQPRGCRIQLLSLCAEDIGDAELSAAYRMLRAVYPNAPIVVLDSAAHIESVRFAFRIGAASYIPSTLEADVALAALSFVLDGGSYFPLDVLKALPEFPPGAPPPPRPTHRIAGEVIRVTASVPPRPAPEEERPEAVPEEPEPSREIGDLTLRQHQVLERLPLGHSNKEIARELGMSEATVKVHVRQVMKRLGVANRTQAAVVALRLRIPVTMRRTQS